MLISQYLSHITKDPCTDIKHASERLAHLIIHFPCYIHYYLGQIVHHFSSIALEPIHRDLDSLLPVQINRINCGIHFSRYITRQSLLPNTLPTKLALTVAIKVSTALHTSTFDTSVSVLVCERYQVHHSRYLDSEHSNCTSPQKM